MKDHELKSGIAAIEDWFAQRGWQPFPFQREVWQAYREGEHGLIHSPTGTGKTYAAFLGPLAEWIDEHGPDALAHDDIKRKDTPPLLVLWITPLRALAADTTSALQAPIQALGLPWSLEARTGDTSSTVRSRQSKRLPTVLVTTPESLSLFLARKNARALFENLRLVVVDEWHELLGSKRGTQTELGLARLRNWHPDLRIWGLSATMGNLDQALRTLVGAVNPHTAEVPAGRLIQGDLSKRIVIDSVLPETMERFPWAGHLGLKLLPQVLDELDQLQAGQSALIFTNTRAQTEIWFQALLDARPDLAGLIALHHSSIDGKTRTFVEDSLRDGSLRAVVCTSSLDLGVDFAPVDRVFQVGSPKGVGRLLQRAGRSGHQPRTVSRVTCVPTHALELIEVAAARQAASAGQIEARVPVDQPLDVLVQHLVTIGLGGGFDQALYDEVRTAASYRRLSREAWEWCVDFVTYGGDALSAYPQYARVQRDEATQQFTVNDKTVARTHRMSIGTIVSDAMLRVKYLNGATVGHIEESFISRLSPGDKFTLGGKVLTYLRIKDLDVIVRKASSRSQKGIVPRWYGGSLPLSHELTDSIREVLARDWSADPPPDDLAPELRAVQPILQLQSQWSAIPSRDELLIERVHTREGEHLFFFVFEGRLVHEGLSALFAYRISQLEPITFTIAANDYGFELLSVERAPLEGAIDAGLFSTKNLLDDIIASMNASEMARRQFREIARISGLVVERFPGGRKSAKQLQASSGLIYDVLTQYDPDNLLLNQAQREVLERQLEQSRLHDALQRIERGTIRVTEPRRPTPFAFPLLVDRLRQTVSSETLDDRIRKMVESLESDSQ